MPFDAQAAAAHRNTPNRGPNPRPIALWLLAVAGMVWVMVALGGATRLTGSGLSIMEWAPLAGTLPPLSEAEWRRLYALYQTIPQYALVNQGFGLEGFKEIFWLEWAHRLWGRLIGLAYALPLAIFWLRGRIPQGYRRRLLLLLLLGGMQGAVCWFMVASGFEAERTAVSPYRLVMHLSLALGLYAALLWTGLSLLRDAAPRHADTSPAPHADTSPAPHAATRSVRRQVKAAAWLVVAAMLAGGFVAGIKAGFDYNSFPLMDGQLVPAGYWRLTPTWTNLTLNIPAVQFNHRLLASLATFAALGAGLAGWRRLPPGAARGACLGLGAAACLQYALGIATLLLVVPAWLGTLHQACAVLVLTATLLALHSLRDPPSGSRRRAA